MRALVLVLTLAFSTAALAQETVEIKCTSGSDHRVLKIQTVDKGCKLSYTKMGEEKELASQKVGFEKCDTVSAKVRSTLEASGYTCQ